MDASDDYALYAPQQPSYPPPAPPAAYLPPSAPSYNPYGPRACAPNSTISPPSHYPPTSLNTYSSYASNPFSPQAFYPTTFYDDVPIEALNFLQSALDQVKGLSRMADPLSVIASVVAITTAAVQVSQTLYKLADTIGGTNSEVESIAFEVETFSSVLDDLRDLLDDSEDLITPKALKNANSILSRCKGIFDTIQQMLAPYKHADRISFWHGVQWTFKRERVKPMRCRLEALKTSLLVWLGTVRLARHRRQPSVE
jgi:Fungal N-terminal domain of STAND proteins